MADKINEAPPSYYAAQQPQGPSAPKPAYAQQYPPQDQQQQYGGYPPQGANYYQQQPNMGYYPPQQGGPYQQGPYSQGPYQQPYGRPNGHYQQDNRGNGGGVGLIEGLMAGLCCCCCLDVLF